MNEISSSITDVCVYLAGASVTRSATVKNDGQRVLLKGLPCRLNDESIQFEAPTGSYIQNSSIDLVPVSKNEQSSELDELRSYLGLLNTKEDSLQEQINAIDNLLPATDIKSKAGFSEVAKAMGELEQFKLEQFKTLNEEFFKVQKEIKELKKKIKNIKKNKNGDTACTKTVSFELISDKNEVEVKIHYLVADASWAPSYAVNVNSEYTSGTLSMNALVSQNSGEDWKGVNIRLSTATPYQFRKLPELKSQFIGRKQQEGARSTFRPAPADTESLFFDFDKFSGVSSSTPIRTTNIPKKSVNSSFRLIVLSEAARGLEYYITHNIVRIGSSSENELVLDDGTVSFNHAILEYRHDALYVSDLGSTNGTYINGDEIFVETQLHNSDILQIGGVEILVADDEMDSENSNISTNVFLDAGETVAVAAAPAAGSIKRSAGASASKNRSVKMKASKSSSIAAETESFSGRRRASRNKSMVLKSKSVSNLEEPQRKVSYLESPAEGINRHSSLYMETQDKGHRGKLTWKSNLDIYRMQLQKLGYTGDVTPIINLLTDKSMKIDPLPAKVVDDLRRYDYSFIGNYTVNVPSSKHHFVIPLQESRCDFELTYLCIPRESKAFYRNIRIKNPFDTPLLTGPMDIYLEKSFVNTGQLSSAPKGGYVNLILGEEQNIKLVRRTHFKEETHGIMNGKNLLLHRIENEVTNRTGKAIRVELRERLPYPAEKAEKSIEVEFKEAIPQWNPLPKEESGGYDHKIHFWKAELENEESKEFKFSYEIEISSKEELSGGNRREFS